MNRGKVSRVTDDQRKEILRLRGLRHTLKEIAKAVGVSPATASRIGGPSPSPTSQGRSSKKPLPQWSSGDGFRLWLEIELFHLDPPYKGYRFERGVSDDSLRHWLADAAGIDEKQIRLYLGREEPGIIRADVQGRNPSIESAIRIAEALRRHSNRSNPLHLLFAVPDFFPHGLGVVGNLCQPGPTRELVDIWPAIQWLITQQLQLKERALGILTSDAFHERFQRAWIEWSRSKDTSHFADPLRDAIELARETPRKFWHLSDGRLSEWVDWVAREPEFFGRWMQMLDSRAVCARDVFKSEIERWDKHRILNAETLVHHATYLHDLLEGERVALLTRVKNIFLSCEDLKRYADFL